MEPNEEIELQLWEYIDCTCTDADKERIALLVANDAAWREKFDALTVLHADIEEMMEVEQPSMRFTKNVMEAVAQVQIATPTKQYINRGIIRGIAAFFLIGIFLMIGYAFATTKWNSSTASIASSFSFSKLSGFISSPVINIVIAINVVLLLVLVDTLLRRKRNVRKEAL